MDKKEHGNVHIIIQQTRSIIRRYYIYNYYGMLLDIYRNNDQNVKSILFLRTLIHN